MAIVTHDFLVSNKFEGKTDDVINGMSTILPRLDDVGFVNGVVLVVSTGLQSIGFFMDFKRHTSVFGSVVVVVVVGDGVTTVLGLFRSGDDFLPVGLLKNCKKLRMHNINI